MFIFIDLKSLRYQNDIFLLNLKTHVNSPPHVSSEMDTLLLPVHAKIAVYCSTSNNLPFSIRVARQPMGGKALWFTPCKR